MKWAESNAAINLSDACPSKSFWSSSAVYLPNQMFFPFMKQVCRDTPVVSVPFLCGFPHSHQSITELCNVHLTTQHRWWWCQISSQYLLTD